MPADVAVHGEAFDDADFDLGSAVGISRIPVAGAGDLSITASLNYQTIAHGFLQDLYGEAHLEQVQTFKSLYEAQDLKYERIASARTTAVSDGGGPAPVPVVDLVATTPTLDLTASPASVVRGGAITLSWNATNAGSCVATGGWSGAKANTGTESVPINDPVTFTLTCSGEGGSVSDSVSYRARGRRWLELR